MAKRPLPLFYLSYQSYVIEQDVTEEYAYKHPVVYKAGQEQRYFSFKVFWKWIILSIWHGAVTFFGCQFSLSTAGNKEGHVVNHWFITTTAFTVIIHIIIYKLLLETVYWNTLSIGTIVLCFSLYYIMTLGLSFNPISTIFQPQLNGILISMIGTETPNFWILLIVLPFFALTPDITITLFQRVFFPTPVDAVMLTQQNHVEQNEKERQETLQSKLGAPQLLKNEVHQDEGDIQHQPSLKVVSMTSPREDTQIERMNKKIKNQVTSPKGSPDKLVYEAANEDGINVSPEPKARLQKDETYKYM